MLSLVPGPDDPEAEPLTVHAARELFHLRAVLEAEAAALAATRDIDIDELRRLEAWARATEECDERGTFVSEHADFHVALTRLGGNRRLAAVVEQAYDELGPYMHLADHWTDVTPADADHVGILDAIKRGDAERARAEARAHTAGAQKLVLDALLSAHASESADVLTLLRSDLHE